MIDKDLVTGMTVPGLPPYPVLHVDWRAYPDLADNIWHAQMAGWPRLLTYCGPDLTVKKANRKSAMRYEHDGQWYHIPRILSRDEYPFACTLEGGDSWVGHIPPEQNSAQGGLIAGFLRKHGIVGGRGEHSKFLVEVVHHPRGPVTTPDVGSSAP